MTGPAHILEPVYPDKPSGIDMRVLLRAGDTGGAVSLFEEMTPPDTGPPLHVHFNEDEFFRVLAGTFRFQAGGQVIDAGAGDTLFVPRGTPHCFCNTGRTTGRLFMGFAPGGGEAFFDWIAGNGMPSGDSGQAAMIRDRFAIEFLGPNPFIT